MVPYLHALHLQPVLCGNDDLHLLSYHHLPPLFHPANPNFNLGGLQTPQITLTAHLLSMQTRPRHCMSFAQRLYSVSHLHSEYLKKEHGFQTEQTMLRQHLPRDLG